jgi:hypothetical protein|eukprot:COSAG01_NODE_4589_length_4893_cov_2.834585_1_plen_513_part_00
MEERILATARQKLFIDKLVIKDARSAAEKHHQNEEDDEQSVSMLWATLCHGAAELLGPARNGRTLSAEDYDAILDGAVERAAEEEDDAMVQAEAMDTAVGDADSAMMTGVAASAAAQVAAAAAADAEATESEHVSNYDLFAYGKTRLLKIGIVGLQQLCQARGIWSPAFGSSEAAAALLVWKSNRAEAQAQIVDLAEEQSKGSAVEAAAASAAPSEPYASPARPVAGLDPAESYTGLGVEGLRMVFPAEQNPDVPDRVLIEALALANGELDMAFEHVCTLKAVPATRRRLLHAGVAADAWVCAGDGHKTRIFEAVQAADGDAARAAASLGAAQAVHAATINGMDRASRKGRGIGAKRYAPPPAALKKKVGSKAKKLRHDDNCFCCDDGGEVLQCDVCPRVYHLQCIGLTTEPKGMWRCPWHLCWTCQRKSSSAGGKLFHCMTCPETYCFDCVPDRYIAKNHEKALALATSLESRGCHSIKNFLFFRCDDCLKDGRKWHSADDKSTKRKRVNG